jgi:hypothetical protein
MGTTMSRTVLLCLLAILCIPASASAQYFGRNKVRYEDFDFRVIETEHFDLYNYEATSQEAVEDAARMAERWYGRFSKVFNHRFEERKPLILYADQPDFQQTNTTPGFVSQSTGGFTEGLKDRVVLPLTETYGETDHVLGHELVHVFQFDMAQAETGGGLTGFQRLPLWFVEGLAEYLSLGRADVHTAMWMRDAVLRDDLPTLRDLSTDPDYFPYRYGQAFWAYVAGHYGDNIVPALYRAAGQQGIEAAVETILHSNTDSLSQQWIRATREHFVPLVRGRGAPEEIGEPILAREAYDNEWSLAPVLSPDGRRVIFLSQRDLFTIDLFVADAETGEIQGKLAETVRNPHFDAIAFLGSSGTWSPDGRQFAFITYAEGDNEIAIADVADRDVVRTLDLPGVGTVYDVAWSPDGSSIAFSGGAGGITDLYRADLATGEVERLTQGPYAELQPAWSPDGSTLAFATDRGEETDLERLRFAPMGLGVLDVATGRVEVHRPFAGAKHINPQYAPDGQSLYFLSDRGGFSDVYRLDRASGQVFQVTEVATGVSGITALSPALSVASGTGRLAFSVFRDGGYHAYALDAGRARGEPVTASPTGSDLAGILPPADPSEPALVDRYLEDLATGLPASPAFAERPYDVDLQLDYVAPPSAGVAVDRFGASIGGSIGFFFSDMLGDHQLGLGVQANGTLEDLGGRLIYVNRDNRISWGGSVGRTTYRSAFGRVSGTTVEGVPARVVEIILDRTFFTGGSVMAEYPFSTTRRIEGDLGFTRVGFDREVDRAIVIGNTVVSEEKENLDAADPLNLGHASVALVEDFSFFGFTSPVRGGRSRFEVGGNTGTLDFASVLADWRRYFFARPVTLAVRAFHLGRYAADAENFDRLTPLFVGYPTLVRGYEAGSFEPEECSIVPEEPEACPEFDRLVGSRLGVANLEFRAPLFGTEEYGLLGGGFFPTELALFADGGVAWTSDESPELAFERESTERIPVFSAGGALRFNLFGSVVAELYYAYPFQRPESGWRWGFQIAPGW